MIKGSGWCERNEAGTTAHCRSCGKDPASIPGPNCTAERHMFYHLKRKASRQKLQTPKNRYWRAKLDVIELLGGKCRCGNTDPRVLQINHINGGGTKERQITHLDEFRRDILAGRRSINDLEILCANCNILYEFEVGRRVVPDKFKHLIPDGA